MGYVVGTSLYELACAFDILGPKDGEGLQFRFQPLDGQVGAGWQKLPLLPVEIRPGWTPRMRGICLQLTMTPPF